MKRRKLNSSKRNSKESCTSLSSTHLWLFLCMWFSFTLFCSNSVLARSKASYGLTDQSPYWVSEIRASIRNDGGAVRVSYFGPTSLLALLLRHRLQRLSGSFPSLLENMKVDFAPLDVPLQRRLQTATVLQWVYSFLGLAPTCIVLFVYLLFTRYWLISVLYATWWYFDYDTPSQGGRRLPYMCGLKVWGYMRDYFPVKLVKTADLDPRHNYVFGFHPHGVLVAGAFTNFCTYATGFRQLFPGITSYMLMLPLWFRAPFFRDYIMFAGLIPSDKESASYPLSRKGSGNAVVIAVGGAPEALDARPGSYNVMLAKKKGFIKMAMEHGAHLVPVFSFGENEVFDQVDNSRGTWLRWTQERLQSIMGISLPLFHARGIFQYSFGLMPYRKPINTIVGRPIKVERNTKPPVEELDALHQLYMDELSNLFEEHKGNYGVDKDTHLNFL